MESCKFLYLEGVPQASEAQVQKVFRQIGDSVWRCFKVFRDEGTMCGLVEFNSAAQVKIAVETLKSIEKETNVSVFIDDETWAAVQKSAGSATVQSVTRMAPAALENRLKLAFKSIPPTTKKQHKDDFFEPDGTLDYTEYPLEYTDLIKKGIEEFRSFTTRKQKELEKELETLLEKQEDPEEKRGSFIPQDLLDLEKKCLEISDAEVERAQKEFQEELTRKNSLFDSFRDLQDRLHQSWKQNKEADEKLVESRFNEVLTFTEDTPFRGDSALVKAIEAISSESLKIDLNQTDKIAQIVEEYFGVQDEDVIAFVESHICDKKSRQDLAAEFSDTLEDDTNEFVDKVFSL